MSKSQLEMMRPHLEAYAKLKDEQAEKMFAWLRNLITIASGLVAVLVALKPKTPTLGCSGIYFFATIVSLSIGILCGSAALYNEIKVLDAAQKEYHKYIQGLFENQNFHEPFFAKINDWRYYKPLLAICLTAFALALVGLCIYSYNIGFI